MFRLHSVQMPAVDDGGVEDIYMIDALINDSPAPTVNDPRAPSPSVVLSSTLTGVQINQPSSSSSSGGGGGEGGGAEDRSEIKKVFDLSAAAVYDRSKVFSKYAASTTSESQSSNRDTSGSGGGSKSNKKKKLVSNTSSKVHVHPQHAP